MGEVVELVSCCSIDILVALIISTMHRVVNRVNYV